MAVKVFLAIALLGATVAVSGCAQGDNAAYTLPGQSSSSAPVDQDNPNRKLPDGAEKQTYMN